MDKFNVNGGSLAYGHPFAAAGTRLITVVNELRRRGGDVGLTTVCRWWFRCCNDRGGRIMTEQVSAFDLSVKKMVSESSRLTYRMSQ